MRNLIFIFSIALVNPAAGQLFFRSAPDTSNAVIINLEAYQGSGGLDNEFLGYFVKGGQIPLTLREDISSGLQDINYAGGEYRGSLSYVFHPDSLFGKPTDIGLVVSYAIHEVASIRFSRSTYDLVFLGNESYLNDTLDLSDLLFDNQAFTKLSLGYVHPSGKFSAKIGLVGGQRFNRLSLSKGQIISNPTGSSLNYSLEGNYNRNSNSRTITDFQGAGLSLDLRYDFTVTTLSNKGTPLVIRGELSDLGFISWNASSEHTVINSAGTFDGLTINSLENVNETIEEQIEAIEDTLVPRSSAGRDITLLPTTLTLGTLPGLNDSRKLEPLIGVRVRMAQTFIPSLMIGMHYQPVSAFALQLIGNYGGYGNLQLGLGTDLSLGKHFHWRLYSNAIINSFMKNGTGHSLNTAFVMSW